MSDGNGATMSEPARIVIEYNTKDGRFSMSCNVKDEVLTTGMIAKANDVLKQNYRVDDMQELKKKMNSEIIAVPGLKVQ